MKIFENEFRWRVVDNLFGDRKVRRQPLRRKPFLMGLLNKAKLTRRNDCFNTRIVLLRTTKLKMIVLRVRTHKAAFPDSRKN